MEKINKKWYSLPGRYCWKIRKDNVSKMIDYIFSGKNDKFLDDIRNGIVTEEMINDGAAYVVGYILKLAFFPRSVNTLSKHFVRRFSKADLLRLFELCESDDKYNINMLNLVFTSADFGDFYIISGDLGDKVNDVNFIMNMLDHCHYFTCFDKSEHRELILAAMERDKVFYPLLGNKIINIEYYFSCLNKIRDINNSVIQKIILAAYEEIGPQAVKHAIETLGKINGLISKKIMGLDGVWEIVSQYRVALPTYTSGISSANADSFIKECPHLLHTYSNKDKYFELELEVQKIRHEGMYIKGYILDKTFSNLKPIVPDEDIGHYMHILEEIGKLEYYQVDRKIMENIYRFIHCHYRVMGLSDKEKLHNIIFNSPTLMKILYKGEKKCIAYFSDINVDITDPDVAKYYIKYCKKYKYINIKQYNQAKTLLNESEF